MKAAIYKDIGRIEIEDVKKPELSDDTALVKVLKTGICGTDLKTYKRGHPLFKPPCVLGHEFSGIVEEVGKNVESSSVGKKYAFAPYIECGKCEVCRSGLKQMCSSKIWIEGALAEYVSVPAGIIERGSVEIPDTVEDDVATLAEPLACALHGIEKAGVRKEDKVLIVGAGIMGLLMGIYLKNKGSDTFVSELDDNRLGIAESIGLQTIDGGKVNFEEMKKSHGLWNKVIIANDKGSLVPKVLPHIQAGGCLLLFGGMPKDMRIEVDPYYVHYKEIDIVGSFGFASEHFKNAAKMIFSDLRSFSKLISSRMPFNRVTEAFGQAMESRNIKVIVENQVIS